MMASSRHVSCESDATDHLTGENCSCAFPSSSKTQVLGALGEKARTVPDTYPLTLDALTRPL